MVGPNRDPQGYRFTMDSVRSKLKTDVSSACIMFPDPAKFSLTAKNANQILRPCWSSKRDNCTGGIRRQRQTKKPIIQSSRKPSTNKIAEGDSGLYLYISASAGLGSLPRFFPLRARRWRTSEKTLSWRLVEKHSMVA